VQLVNQFSLVLHLHLARVRHLLGLVAILLITLLLVEITVVLAVVLETAAVAAELVESAERLELVEPVGTSQRSLANPQEQPISVVVVAVATLVELFMLVALVVAAETAPVPAQQTVGQILVVVDEVAQIPTAVLAVLVSSTLGSRRNYGTLCTG
jgi:hypothetical protein